MKKFALIGKYAKNIYHLVDDENKEKIISNAVVITTIEAKDANDAKKALETAYEVNFDDFIFTEGVELVEIGFIEKIDASQIITDWNTISYNDSAWSPAVEIDTHPVAPWTGQLQPNLTRVIEEEISPVSVTLDNLNFCYKV